MGFPPLVTPPAQPLDLEGVEVWVLPRTIGRMVGEGRARDAVTERFLRPADLDGAEMGPVEAIWIPVWRVKGSADSFSLDLVTTVETIRGATDAIVLGGAGRTPPDSRKQRGRARTRTRTRPVGGYRHHDGTLSILARRGFPIDPGLQLSIPLADLIPVDEAKLDPVTTVLPDLPREDAAEAAEHALRRRGEPSSALFAHVKTSVADARLVFYPLYVIRYRYGGEAVDGGPSIFFAALSGTTGKVVASHHPSALKSVVGRLGRWLGRDQR
ncbi:MAG: hypothetical protein M5U28_30995 [Sandaracinaceae bacterium]|nr:hypothetical protein [Sandaracinaceae bacterium]